MSDSVRPHRRQPTRLPHPWDSPGKNTGVGCHFLLQCTKVKSEREVAQSCPTLSDPMDYSLPGPSIHGILQARVLEWGAITTLGYCPAYGRNYLSESLNICVESFFGETLSLFNLHRNRTATVSSPVLRKLKLREVEKLAPHHIAAKGFEARR